MGVFGEAVTGNVSQEDPLGLRQAPEEETGNPGQPQNAGPAGTGNINQTQRQRRELQGQKNKNSEGQQQRNISQQQQTQQSQQNRQQEPAQQQIQEPEIEINVDDDREKKIAFLREKFDGQEDFEKSYNELEQRLGLQGQGPDINNVTQEEIIDYYIQMEKQKGQQGQQQPQQQPQRQTNIYQENQRLKQDVNGLRNSVQQLMLQLQQGQQQQPQQPQRDTSGRFVSPNNQQRGQQNQQGSQGPTAEEIVEDLELGLDPEESLSDLYEKGYESDSFKKAVAMTANKLIDQKLEQQQQTQQQQQQQQQQIQQQAQQYNQHFRQQAEQLKQQYGENEFERLKPEMQREFRKYPMYLNPNLFPNGFQQVFHQVRERTNNYQQQQNTIQNQQQQNNIRKQTARVPGSNPNQRFNTQKPSQEEIEKRQIFEGNPKQGIFG